jgi:hypothetical protein
MFPLITGLVCNLLGGPGRPVKGTGYWDNIRDQDVNQDIRPDRPRRSWRRDPPTAEATKPSIVFQSRLRSDHRIIFMLNLAPKFRLVKDQPLARL